MSGTTVVTYQLQYRASGTDQWIDYGGLTTETSELVTGLMPGTDYDFQVLATNGFGTTTSPIIRIQTQGLPPKIVSLNLTTNGIGSVNASAIVQHGAGVGSVHANLFPIGNTVINTTVVGHSVAALHGIGQATATALSGVLAALVGTGQTSVTPVTTYLGSSRLASAGVLFAKASIPQRGTVVFSGIAAVLANGIRQVSASSQINTLGSVTPTASVLTKASASILANVATTAAAFNLLVQQWSATHKLTNGAGGSTINLSNNNLTATEAVATNDSSVYATNTTTSGKYYWEIFVSYADVTNISVGIGNINAGIFDSQWVGSDPNSLGYVIAQGTVSVNGNGTGTTDIATGWPIVAASGSGSATFCFALDATNNLIWGRVANGTWFGATGASGPNPATGSGGLPIPSTVFAAAISPGCTLNAVGDFCIGQFASSAWLYAAPSGFMSWTTVNSVSTPANLTTTAQGSGSETLTWTAS